MYLTRHRPAEGPRWALDDRLLPPAFNLELLQQIPRAVIGSFLHTLPGAGAANETLMLENEVDTRPRDLHP